MQWGYEINASTVGSEHLILVNLKDGEARIKGITLPGNIFSSFIIEVSV